MKPTISKGMNAKNKKALSALDKELNALFKKHGVTQFTLAISIGDEDGSMMVQTKARAVFVVSYLRKMFKENPELRLTALLG